MSFVNYKCSGAAFLRTSGVTGVSGAGRAVFTRLRCHTTKHPSAQGTEERLFWGISGKSISDLRAVTATARLLIAWLVIHLPILNHEGRRNGRLTVIPIDGPLDGHRRIIIVKLRGTQESRDVL